MKKPTKTIDVRRLRVLAPAILGHIKGGGIGTTPTGPTKGIDPCTANPCGN